jgi:hypothetical protein
MKTGTGKKAVWFWLSSLAGCNGTGKEAVWFWLSSLAGCNAGVTDGRDL